VTKSLFRILGTAHGIAGLFTLSLVAYLLAKGGISELGPGPLAVRLVGTIGGALVISCLVASMVATWRSPTRAPVFAWLAAIAYIATPIIAGFLGSNLLSQLDTHFYYSAAIRLVAALVLTLLAQRANYSLKRTVADGLR
jgi:hypothetical protein